MVQTKIILLIGAVALLAAGCTLHPEGGPLPPPVIRVKDNHPDLWISQHPRVRGFRAHYLRNATVEAGLQRAQRYLPTITAEFQRRNLPLELAFLPMLESFFTNRADSGSARGLWQFIPSTAIRQGLKVGFLVDERMNWRKATTAAADYLDELGGQFNYDWALALAAYNGGPGYVERATQDQGTRDFFKLALREETADYVPRFVAMLQVAREKYPRLMVSRY